MDIYENIQPDYSDLWDAYVAGARSARKHTNASEFDFQRSADAFCKLVHSRKAPLLFAAIGGMEHPTKIDDNTLLFRGLRYTWDGRCFKSRKTRKLLFRAVYEAWHSEPVRKGQHVRPRDGNYRNCDIKNLELVRGTAQY